MSMPNGAWSPNRYKMRLPNYSAPPDEIRKAQEAQIDPEIRFPSQSLRNKPLETAIL